MHRFEEATENIEKKKKKREKGGEETGEGRQGGLIKELQYSKENQKNEK